MKRVLVTGATGFVGRQCVDPLLERGYTVHTVSASAPSSRTDVQHHVCDLLDQDATSRLLAQVRASHLLHAAWYAVPGAYWTSEENLRWVEASLALVRNFRSYGGHRIVGVGSCAEYDWTAGRCVELDTPMRPATLYGTCKYALGAMLSSWAARSSMSAAWGRLFFLYGPHEHPDRLVPSVIRGALEGRSIKCTAGTQRRDYQHVSDAAAALVALLDSDVTGSVNIASGRAVPVKDIVLAIADKLDARTCVQLGALPISASDPPVLEADVSRLRDEVGWRDRLDASTGLDETIDWWRR